MTDPGGIVDDGGAPDGIAGDAIVPGAIVPDAIVPDDKDWTWVLERPCPECGVDVRSLPRERVGDVVRALARAWGDALGAAPDAVRTRPRSDRWSALEYGAHVRDVFRVYDERLALMLSEDDPGYPNWDQDATAVTDRYAEADPATVARELTAAATALADRFDAVEGSAWSRTGNRSDGARFTVETFARYMVHDPLHHLADIGADPAPLLSPG